MAATLKPPEAFSEERADALARALRRRIKGEVRFDHGSRALYATDASNYRQTPIGVVIPRDVDDIVAAVAGCREHDAPVLPRGGGTSLAGQTCNVAVVIDASKYLNRVLALDPERRRARVEPGCVLDTLRDAAEEHGLTFGPDPATHDHNTLGGMLGNNSCGVHSIMAQRTADNVASLDVLCYDGTRLTVGPTSEDELRELMAGSGRRAEIYRALAALRQRYAEQIRRRFPKIPRRVSGFGLDELLPENGCNVARALVGSEGTCVTVLEAELELVPSPRERVLVLLGYDDVYAAADDVPRVLEAEPIGLEGMDNRLIDYMRRKGMHAHDLELLPEGNGWLMAEIGADTRTAAEERGRALCARIGNGNGEDSPALKLLSNPDEQKRVWEIRESGLGATAFVPDMPDAWPGWEDSAVPPERLGEYLRDLRRLLERYGYDGSFYGHFGDGVVHTRLTFDLASHAGAEKWRAMLDESAELVARYGGSLSGEHGDGQQRAALTGKIYGEELMQAFREFKAIWDPQGRMNPGKAIDPYPIVSNLRLRAPERPLDRKTHFAFHEDGGSFAHAALRCVGVGKCRRYGGGVMCPSYMATHEEKHSTRGRARLLFEMLHEGALDKGWRSDAVHDALDLCLACKGCKSDCPVNVDMATYKAEFNAHYYAKRWRPRAAYAFGNIYWWARAAALAPKLANGVSQSKLGGALLRKLGGIARERELPRFAARPFTAEYRNGGSGGPRTADGGGAEAQRVSAETRPVLLWPDTFNNYLTPAPLHAAVEVLAAAGYTAVVPERPLCCGRPLYAWGWIERARRLLEQTLDTLEPHIAAGTPLVGLEPACVSTFRDELPDLFPEDERAKRLSEQSFSLAEFLARTEFKLPQRETRGFGRKALVQVHCHDHASLDADAGQRLLEQTGLEFEVLDSGCCGMAGGFGFEAEHYGVSMQCAERVLLPAVRAAPSETLVIADGYSCREQIAQATGRRPLHSVEALRAALRSCATTQGEAHESKTAER